ncbi:hypothetical protein FNV43_RR10224 [Rhamnella rubrinervis]|uniref:Uncharacterized protein n=1 Tax=Rhamnella rubrinervis TaxID=2594499 RepID=A0A8K0MKI1_9ROSA|nr:hypothetical protein FNV43_RR10224 [Rhamnella rubrinervis]
MEIGKMGYGTGDLNPPNRAQLNQAARYWSATGTDKPVLPSSSEFEAQSSSSRGTLSIKLEVLVDTSYTMSQRISPATSSGHEATLSKDQPNHTLFELGICRRQLRVVF